jgi:NhaP-type Na+/H+ or K+/H+ antiporter
VEGVHPAFTLVLALAVGVVVQSVARHLRVPGIVLLLLTGAGLGPDGIGWIDPRALGDGLFAIVDIGVAVILFEGGLNLEISRLRREQAPIRRLVTGGALVTLLGGMLAARVFLDWPWMQSMLFGSLVVVTGPTVVGPLIEELRLRPRVATVLEAEGVMIDPIGAILAVLLLGVALAPGADSLASGAQVLVLRLGFGAVAGVLGGFVLAGLLRVRRLVPEGHENIFVLVCVLLLFEGCDEIVSHSGILAVTIAGVVVGNLRTRIDRDLREFKDQLTVLLIGLLFVLLAADVRIEDVQALGAEGIAVVAALVLIVRPLTVWLSTAASELTVRERLLIAWIAPRGIVAAAVASLTAGALEGAGLTGGAELRALVFLTIAGTVLLAGFSAGPVATLLGQRLPGRDGVAILGAQGLGLDLGEVLRKAEVPVVFLDSNPGNCRQAEESGFSVVFGNALQERTVRRARLESVGTVIGLTPNQMLNSVFVSRTRERFRVPRGYVALARPEAGLAPELVQSEEAVVLFDGPHDIERWDVRCRHGSVEVEPWVYGGAPENEQDGEEAPESPPKTGDPLVILALRRGGKTTPMHAGLDFKEGDIAWVAVHTIEREEAHAALRAEGWEPHREEEAGEKE